MVVGLRVGDFAHIQDLFGQCNHDSWQRPYRQVGDASDLNHA